MAENKIKAIGKNLWVTDSVFLWNKLLAVLLISQNMV